MENIKNTMKFTNIQKQSEEKLNQIISDIEKLNLPNVKQNLFQLQRLIIELESENEILRNEAKKNRKLQDSIMDGFVFVNMQGVIIETNDSFQQITGYNADELKTLTYFDLTPENWHAFEDNIVNTQILVRGYSDVYKKEYIKKDGTIIPVEFRTYLIQDDNGNNEGMWAIVRDKSKRKAAENVLFEKEQQLKLILENIPGMFFALDKEGVFILSEGQQLASIEKKPNEVIGKSVFDLFRNHPEIISCIKRAFNGEVVVNENLIENIFFHVTYSPTRDRLGEINGVIGVSIDITQRKKAEELLQISEKTYRNILNNVTEAIYVQDENGCFLDVNQAVEKLYGYEQDYFLGKTPEFLSAPGKNDFEMINNAVKLAFNDIPQQFEFWGIKKDGTIFPKEVNLTSTIYFGQKAIIAVARDITERKHNEEAIRESEKRFKTMAENMSNALQNILSRNH